MWHCVREFNREDTVAGTHIETARPESCWEKKKAENWLRSKKALRKEAAVANE